MSIAKGTAPAYHEAPQDEVDGDIDISDAFEEPPEVETIEVGDQAIAFNWAHPAQVYAFGYPQAPPFDGQTLWADANTAYNNGDGTIYMFNDMTGGSSGGYWLWQFDGNWGYVNGHNDFKYTAYPQYMFSPYYGDQVANLYNAVRNLSA